MIPVAWIVCVMSWLLIVGLEVESVLITGPIILGMGLVVLILSVRLGMATGIVLAISHVWIVVLFVALVNILSWGPNDAAEPFGIMGFLHLVISGGLTILALRNLPQLWGPDQCPSCGYPRRGLTSDRCPECGEYWNAVDATEAAKRDRA
jgi:hypothetical protein